MTISAAELRRLAAEEQRQMKACKTVEDLNEFWAGRKMIVKDVGPFQGATVDFVEVVGEATDRSQWRLKVKTDLGNTLLLKANQVIILFKKP